MEDAAHVLQFVAGPFAGALGAFVIGIYRTVALWANQFPESRHAGRGCPRLAEIPYKLTISME